MASLDRIISIGIQGPDGSDDGTPVPGEIVDSPVWARQVDYRHLSPVRRRPGPPYRTPLQGPVPAPTSWPPTWPDGSRW